MAVCLKYILLDFNNTISRNYSKINEDDYKKNYPDFLRIFATLRIWYDYQKTAIEPTLSLSRRVSTCGESFGTITSCGA